MSFPFGSTVGMVGVSGMALRRSCPDGVQPGLRGRPSQALPLALGVSMLTPAW